MHQRTSHACIRYTHIILALIISLWFLCSLVPAQEQGALQINIYDLDDDSNIPMEPPYVFYEGGQYGIAISYEGETGYAYGVTITTLGETYVTGQEVPEIVITAPSFEEYQDGFVITASKEEYVGDEVTITISKGYLVVLLKE